MTEGPAHRAPTLAERDDAAREAVRAHAAAIIAWAHALAATGLADVARELTMGEWVAYDSRTSLEVDRYGQVILCELHQGKGSRRTFTTPDDLLAGLPPERVRWLAEWIEREHPTPAR